MKTEDEIILEALEREHARLVKIADKAKADVEECINAGSELLEIHNALFERGLSATRIADLSRRRVRLEAIEKKDLIKLINKQSEAEWDRDLVASVIARRRFFLELKQHNRIGGESCS